MLQALSVHNHDREELGWTRFSKALLTRFMNLQIQLASIKDQGDVSTGKAVSSTIQAGIGGSDTNA